MNRDATRPIKASGLEDVRAYGKAGSLAVSPQLDYLRGFYLARLRLVKTRRQKDVSTCTAAMSRWACAILDCVQWCIVFNVRVCLICVLCSFRLCSFSFFLFHAPTQKERKRTKRKKNAALGFAFVACTGLFGLTLGCTVRAF